MNQRETFILKLLRTRQQQEWHLTFSLRNIKSDEVHTFSSARELAAYLESGSRAHNSGNRQDDE